MDAAKWPQNFPEVGGVKAMEEVVSNTCNSSSSSRPPMLERKARPQEQLNCPRCNSTNTKFCYYNNYSLTQPRYFCKTCRRYWTEGGSLRNVPVGGGSRKNKRSISSSAAAASSSNNNNNNYNKLIIPDLNPPSLSHFSSHENRKILKGGQDLNLGFQVMHNNANDMSQYADHPAVASKAETNTTSNDNINNNMSPVSALDLLRTGIASRAGLDHFIPTPMPDSNTLFSSGFPLQDIKPAATLSFSIDQANRFGIQDNIGNGSRLFFPFGELKQLSSASTTEVDHHSNKGTSTSTGYWNGMFGGGSW